MRYLVLALALSLCAAPFAAGCARTTPTPSPTPMDTLSARTAIPTPSGTEPPSATVTYAPTASATPGPTLDPTRVADTVEENRVLLEERAIDPLCLRWEDADDDGEPEWLGLYLRPAEPPRLEGFVRDGEDWHVLISPGDNGEGLGTYATCEMEVSDINADGRTEVLIWGHTAAGADLLHIFIWSDETYRLLASARGDAGIGLEEANGDLAQEIVARYEAGDGLAWEQVHTWDGTHYGWTWERYSWLYADYPHAYPTHSPARAVISFYLALDDRDLPTAYELLSAPARADQPYEVWAAGFDTTLSVEVGTVNELERAGTTAKVTALVRSYDNIDGYVVAKLWDVTWSVTEANGEWRLQAVTNEELDRWEAVYFP